MILSFKDYFDDKILSGQKIQTIRADPSRRWQVGRKIHFATGVRTSNYHQFKEGTCLGIQGIKLDPILKEIHLDRANQGHWELLPAEEHARFARLEGFDLVDELWFFFLKQYAVEAPFEGVIIHWTSFLW